ncbi:PPE family protein [Candidatus Mycobacterium methanotrophicum]|uniref:PPE family protein n=1 Tax=Candidatus Mycobacterium methanotrophicum TaxID=2943498 RepID=A0ABY4QHJ2_9MYCO|nr:PPE family protein [Candidatus Mycobacterium methanotrophicum]UQX10490.1 PPE family protein [Candidatus Mycobacterium methanotrophicum]
MVFDFAARPPEINSTLMYSGSGAGPLTAASATFSALSSELNSNAASYESIISHLGSEWTGPSSTAMAASAQTYITWLTTTSAQLEDAAMAAASSAAAYEAAHAATIPPPVIAANRAQLAALVATNILGQNTPAIAANEAMYGEFWAQDAAAMYGYSAAASAASSALTPLTDPTENTNPAGQGQQAAAVGQAVGSNGTSATLNNALSSTQSAASAAANPAASAAQDSAGSVLSALNGLFGVPVVSNTVYNIGVTLAWNMAMMSATLPMLGHFMGGAAFGVTIGDATPLGAGLGFGTTLAGASSGGFGGGATLAGMGAASSVGGLSVPAGWSAATPAAVTDATLAGSGWTAAVDEGGTGMGGAPSGIMPGMASAAGKSGYGMAGPRYGVKPKVMPKQVFV